jgi:predicted nucleic acid-binding protein
MVAYLDSSVLLQHVLKGDEAIRQVFTCDRVISSELLEIECKRVIHRYRLEGELDDQGYIEAMDRINNVLSGVSLLLLSEPVKKRASQSFPIVIKTLDALHLASAQQYELIKREESLLIFSFDRVFNRCARALGFQVPFSTEIKPDRSNT